MKQLLYIVLIGCVLGWVGCSPYPRESKRVATAFEQAQLVYGEGENDTLLFIPELDKASDYYAQKKDYGKTALAALYYGYSEKDYDKTIAMNAFKEAEQYGELVNDSLTMARAQYQMGMMLYNDYMFEDALVLLSKAEANFGIYYRERALALNATACSQMCLNDFHAVDSCLQQGLVYAELSGSEEVRSKVLNNYAVFCKLQGDYDRAVHYLRMVRPTNTQQVLLNQLNLGDVYFRSGALDSVAYYFELVKENLSDDKVKDESKVAAYKSFSVYEERIGNWSLALDYLKECVKYIVRVKDHIESKNIYRIQQQFDYEALQSKMRGMVITRQRIIICLGLVLALAMVALVLIQKRLVKIREQQIKEKELILFYVRQYTDLLTQQGKTMQKLAIVMDHKDDRALLDNLRATVFGKKDPWKALVDVFDTLHPGEMERICQRYPDLTEMEQKSYILSHFDVSRQDESLLLNMNIHTLDKLRLSVKKKTQKTAENPEKNV